MELESPQLPKLIETTLTSIHPSERATTFVSNDHFEDVTWSDIDIPRVEGVTHFEPRCLHIISKEESIPVVFRSHSSLPLCDAVDLLIGEDHTGLMAWEGSKLLLKWLAYVFVSDLSRDGNREERNGAVHASKMAVDIVELGAGCGFLSVGLANLIERHGFSCHGTSQVTRFSQILRGSILSATEVSICATDGSEECVELIESNFRLRDDLRKDKSNLTTKGQRFIWGDEVAANNIVGSSSETHAAESSSREKTSSKNLILLAGDVVYGIEAIEPLVKATRDLAHSFIRCCGQGESPTIGWILSWMPRSLTKAQNLHLFAMLLEEINHQQNGEGSQKQGNWILKEVFRRDETGETLSSIDPSWLGRADASAFDSCAMDGCILCFSWVV